MGMDYSPEALEIRFQAKIEPDPETDCVMWRGAVSGFGHGRFRTGTWTVGYAHRFAWERAHGPIPSGMVVCHHCDVPACVNVEHLFLGTHADNVRDREAKGRGVRRTGSQAGGPQLRMYQPKDYLAPLHATSSCFVCGSPKHSEPCI